MLRIAICDDEGQVRDSLRLALERLLLEEEEVVYEFASGEGAVRWLRSHPGEIDLLFLDVEMEGLSGLEAAAEIRSFDPYLAIVFVTGYPDFVFEGYRVHALDYLLKPVNELRLKDVLKRVRSQLDTSREAQFAFRNAEGVYRLYRSEILYCYSERRKVFVVTQSKTLSIYAKLDEIEQQLGPGFIRIHQRFLVNGEAVKEMRNDSVLVGDQQLPMSRSMKAQASERLARLMLMA